MWPTPQATPSLIVTHSLELPPSGEWARIVKGALWEIARAENYWESTGGISLDDTLEITEAIYSSLKRAFILQTGDIFPSYRIIEDGTALHCDGQQYLIADFPELAEVLSGVTWSDADYFQVPDLASRVPIGEGGGNGLGAYALNDEGGTETETLSVDQMPAHTHSVHGHLSSIAQLGVGEPVTIPSFDGDTGSAGSGEPHNNLPPYRAVYFYIVTGL